MKVQHSENIKFKSALQRIVSLFETLSDTGSEGYLYAYQVHFQQNRQYVHIRDYFFCVFIKNRNRLNQTYDVHFRLVSGQINFKNYGYY